MTHRNLDFAAVGLGPFNLSVMALAASVPQLRTAAFEKRSDGDWHPGMLVPDARLQTSFLKDLVTPVAPTNPFSFTAYLVAHRRLYRFLSAYAGATLRAEFNDYMRWVARHLEAAQFGTSVDSVALDGRGFQVNHARGTAWTRNVVIGTGLTPFWPNWTADLEPGQALHSETYLHDIGDVTGQHVVVVGGGQSGAEIVLDLLSGTRGTPKGVTLISRRANLQPIDETPFTNEYFTPGYVEAFHDLPPARRDALVAAQKLAGNGISEDTLTALYETVYARRYGFADGPVPDIRPGRDVVEAAGDRTGVQLRTRREMDGALEALDADRVVSATGYHYALPACLDGLRGRLDLDEAGRPRLDARFRMRFDGPPGATLFAQNAGYLSHGIADPQLSLMAWRSGVILNTILGGMLFDEAEGEPFIDWCGERSIAHVYGISTPIRAVA
jgi:lysine N6-hydroxylase